jgi:hypothetical protein
MITRGDTTKQKTHRRDSRESADRHYREEPIPLSAEHLHQTNSIERLLVGPRRISPHVVDRGRKMVKLLVLCMFSGTFLLFLPAVPAWGESQPDNLLNMGIQTASLMELYNQRTAARHTPAGLRRPVFDSAIQAILFSDYPVATEFGPVYANLFVSYSYLRFERQADKESPFQFLGGDYSGRSVSLAVEMDLGSTGGFSEFIGDVYQQDMFVGLFSVWGTRFDLGVLRNRLTLYSEDLGIHGTFRENLAHHYTPRNSDEYQLVFSADITDYLFSQSNIGNTIEYFETTFALSDVLRSTDLIYVPPLLGSYLWYAYSADDHIFGASISYGNLDLARFQHQQIGNVDPKHKQQQESIDGGTEKSETKSDTILFPYKVTANTEFVLNEARIKSSDVLAETAFGVFLASLGFSYLQDPIYENPEYGATNGEVLGFKFMVGFGILDYLFIGQTFSYNHSKYLQFMSGAYDHPVIEFAMRLSF